MTLPPNLMCARLREIDRDGSGHTENTGAGIGLRLQRSTRIWHATPNTSPYGRRNRRVAVVPDREDQTGAIDSGQPLPPDAWRNESPSPPLLNPSDRTCGVRRK